MTLGFVFWGRASERACYSNGDTGEQLIDHAVDSIHVLMKPDLAPSTFKRKKYKYILPAFRLYIQGTLPLFFWFQETLPVPDRKGVRLRVQVKDLLFWWEELPY